MKRILCLILSLTFAALLVACGSDEDKGNNDKDNGQKPNSSGNVSSIVTLSDIKLPEQVVYDEENVKITVTGLSDDDLFGPEIKVMVENNGTKDILVQVDSMAINNIMVTPVFSCEVAAGKKANEGISVMSSELKMAKIELFKEIDVMFRLVDPESYQTIGDSGLIRLTTDLDTAYVQKINTEGVTAHEDDGIKIIIQKLSDDDALDMTNVGIYIENNSDKRVLVTAKNVSVNGFMIDPLFSAEIIPSKVAVDEMSFLNSKLSENNITEITELELNFSITDSDSFSTVKETQKVKVTF